VPMPQVQQTDIHPVSSAVIKRAQKAIHKQNKSAFTKLANNLEAADLADVVEALRPSDRQTFMLWLEDKRRGEVLSYVDQDVREVLFEDIDNKDYAAAIKKLESDDVVQLIEKLDDKDQQEVIESLPKADRETLQETLSFPEESAGRLMRREFLSVSDDWTVAKTTNYLRNLKGKMPADIYDIFVVSVTTEKVVGQLTALDLLRYSAKSRIKTVMKKDIHPIPVEADQEDVAHTFRTYDMVDAPVVDGKGRLIGMITHDDVMDVIDREAEEDLMALAGVGSGGDDLYRDIYETTGSRFPWLAVNLVTAVLASVVIGVFADAIDQIVALAILMPIVASMAGNSGTQTMTVAVRAIAMRELNRANARRIIGKEVLVGALNGVMFAILSGIVAYFWFGTPQMAYVIAAATFGSLICANFSGVVIPFVLHRMNIDPAVSSGVFLTTVTDVVGFLSFLGLASLFLL